MVTSPYINLQDQETERIYDRITNTYSHDKKSSQLCNMKTMSNISLSLLHIKLELNYRITKFGVISIQLYNNKLLSKNCFPLYSQFDPNILLSFYL
jgi:hypothetical protein